MPSLGSSVGGVFCLTAFRLASGTPRVCPLAILELALERLEPTLNPGLVAFVVG
jgi:hypothetical protein